MIKPTFASFLYLLIVFLFLAGCGSGGGGSTPATGDALPSASDGGSTGALPPTETVSSDTQTEGYTQTEGTPITEGTPVTEGTTSTEAIPVTEGTTSSGAAAGTGVAKLSWDSSQEGVAGFVIYYGTSPGTYSYTINAGNVSTYTVSGLASGTYYFAVTAVDSSGAQSPYSNEASKTIP